MSQMSHQTEMGQAYLFGRLHLVQQLIKTGTEIFITTTTTKTPQSKRMLRAICWEFKPGDCVVVIQDYWIGEIGWVTSVNPHFIRIMLTIGILILA
jgi:hypothetical protein